jgi:hypothetical protein
VSVIATGAQGGASYQTAATVNLLPAALPIALAPAAPSPYQTGSSQAFMVTLLAADGTPEPGIPVNFTVTGVNGGLGTATTGSNGIASYTYTGLNAGSDSVQATAIVDGIVEQSGAVGVSWVLPTQSGTGAAVTLLPPPAIGIGGLVGAFADSTGNVIEPLALGTAATRLMVPAGATQLQLGINDRQYADNSGQGFVVAVNGANIHVPATTMPWTWVTAGLNNSYQYGLKDGTAPIVAATGLPPGQIVAIAYQSGKITTAPSRPLVDANGDTSVPIGTANIGGTYYPTLCTTAAAYPQNQPLSLDTLVTDATGAPIANASVTLTVTGANPAQYLATTDASGLAPFLYPGPNLGADTLVAQVASGQGTLTSTPGSITWSAYPNPPPIGAVALNLYAVNNDQQAYTILATDASGNPVPFVNLGFYVTGVDNFEVDTVTDETGHSAFEYFHGVSGVFNILAVESAGRNVTFSNVINGNWTPPTQTSTCSYCNSIQISVGAQGEVTLPNTLQLNGAVTDNVGITPTIAWSEVSGPGTVTFSNPNQAVTTAAFSAAGNYVLQLFATDTGVSASQQVSVAVNPAPVTVVEVQQGFLGSPLSGASVNGIVPITVTTGTTLVSGTTGKRTGATESSGRTLSWSYDGINRLTNEAISQDPAGGNGAVAYGLDPVGNRSSASSTLPGISSSAASFNPDDLQSTESYDANGNTTFTGGRSFAFDSENRLKSMNHGAVSVIYDGFGNRWPKRWVASPRSIWLRMT